MSGHHHGDRSDPHGAPVEPPHVTFSRDPWDPRYTASPGAPYRPWSRRLPKSYVWVSWLIIGAVLGLALLGIILSATGH